MEQASLHKEKSFFIRNIKLWRAECDAFRGPAEALKWDRNVQGFGTRGGNLCSSAAALAALRPLLRQRARASCLYSSVYLACSRVGEKE
jgi:hypothetical protein